MKELVKIYLIESAQKGFNNEELAWPDSYHITQDDCFYISLSRIDKEARFGNERKSSYKIIKMKIY